MKYRKKPVVVEAFQMTRENMDSNANWPKWMHEAWQAGTLWVSDDPDTGERVFQCHTSPWITEDDWLIQEKGEIFPCSPDNFKSTYAPMPLDEYSDNHVTDAAMGYETIKGYKNKEHAEVADWVFGLLAEGEECRRNGTANSYPGSDVRHVIVSYGWVREDLRLALEKKNDAPC